MAEAGDGDAVDPAVAQQRGEIGPVEPRVALGGRVLTLVDDDVDARGVEGRVQRGPGRAGDAVLGPDPALRRERPVVGRMPVAGRDDEVVVAGRREGVQALGDLVPRAGRRARAARREVILEVDDDECLGHRDESMARRRGSA